jgi:hypothetical protein
MDCGAWKNDEYYFVVRIRGSEYRLSESEMQEFHHHIDQVWGYDKDESLSPDYLDLPAPNLGAKITGGLLGLLGMAKPTIRRRA